MLLMLSSCNCPGLNGQNTVSDPVQSLLTDYVSGKHKELIDFSYAGYALGYDSIQISADLKIFHVRDFGGLPDDTVSDFVAIRKCIDAAASSGGGVVQFEKGTYLINESKSSVTPFKIAASNIILSGMGKETVLFMKEPLELSNPSEKWSTPKMITFEPESLQIEILDSRIAKRLEIEDRSITLDQSPNLKKGDIIRITALDTIYNDRWLNGRPTRDIWTFINQEGVELYEYALVKEVNGNRVELYSPLLLDIRPNEPFQIEKVSGMLNNVAVENLHFKGNFQEKFEHHKDGYHDGGHSAIGLSYCFNSWVRNVSFEDVNAAIHVGKSFAVTIQDCEIIAGNGGHSSYGFEMSTRCLSKNCNDYAGQWHGVNSSHASVGNVHYMAKGISRGIDAHARCPRYNLYDNVEGEGFIGNGGNYTRLPNHLRGLVVWNYKQHSKKAVDHDFWNMSLDDPEKLYLGLSAVDPIIVGYSGPKPKFINASETGYFVDSTYQAVQSLYQWQLLKRLQNASE